MLMTHWMDNHGTLSANDFQWDFGLVPQDAARQTKTLWLVVGPFWLATEATSVFFFLLERSFVYQPAYRTDALKPAILLHWFLGVTQAIWIRNAAATW